MHSLTGKSGNYSVYIASFLAVLVFFQLDLGLRVVIPTNVSWLMTVKTDWNTHYLGWFFYRNEPWQFPLGHISRYYYPLGTNVGFTDSIPLLAIFFKIFSPVLPADFQYFGLWLLVCQLLIAYYAIRLCERFGTGSFVTFLVVIFISQNPVLHYREMHPSLCTHWLLLASFGLYFRDPAGAGTRHILRSQLLLLALSSLISPYMLAMEFGFTITIMWKLLFHDKTIRLKSSVIYLSACVALVLLVWYAVGLIGSGKEQLAVTSGYGKLSMNLNALFDPRIWSALLPPLRQTGILQFEGFMYLGAGIFLLIAFLIVYRIVRQVGRRQSPGSLRDSLTNRPTWLPPLGIYMTLLALFAVTNVVSFNDKVLFTYPLPSLVIQIGDIFRASGRFFWAPYYAILFVVLLSFARTNVPGWIKLSFLTLSLMLQLYDIKFLLTYQRPSRGAYDPPIDKKWQPLMLHFDRILFYPPLGTDYKEREDYQYFCYFAANNKEPIDIGYVARVDGRKLKAFNDSLEHLLIAGPVDPCALYVTVPEHLRVFTLMLQSNALAISSMDGYYFMYDRHAADRGLIALVDTIDRQNERQIDSVKTALVSRRFEFERAGIIGSSDEKLAYATGAFTEGKGYIYWNGWAFMSGKQNDKGDSIFAYLAGEKRSYIAAMRIYPRPDVTAAFKAENLDDSGFEGGIFESGVEKGTYSLGIAIREKNGKWTYRLTGRRIDVNPSE